VSSLKPTPTRLKVIESAPRLGDLMAIPATKPPAGRSDRAADDLVALRSTELQPPLASMVDFAELIDSGDLTDDQRHLYTGILVREGRRLTAMINNALALQSLETGHRALDLGPVDVSSLVQRAVLAAGQDELRPISVHVADDLPLASADAEAILDVLANFLSNARRFSPDGGGIRVRARLVGDMVEVSIRDHGIGVEAEALPSLFRKFYRAETGVRRLGPGAGLGLAMNHRVIEAHGGQIEAASKGPGKGAEFRFTLPISRPDAIIGDVLIVDDSAAFSSLMKAEFRAQGLSTVRAADAETAEHMLASMTPRAIILDLVLPGLQGEDFLARRQAGGNRRPSVVVLTGKNLSPAEVTALEAAGAMAVLPKEAGAPQAAVALIAEALATQQLDG
jgi:CheY-like chemotaxis protein